MILALLQLKDGRMKRGSRSLRVPSTGLRNTATRSELDTSVAHKDAVLLRVLRALHARDGHSLAPGGAAREQLNENALTELGMISRDGALLTWASTGAAWDWEGKVRKQ